MTRKRYSIVNNAPIDSFVYTPPDQAHAAARILVKPNLMSRPESPGIVNTTVLGSVLRGLRRAAPMARIVVAEQGLGTTTASQLFQQYDIDQILDQEMRLSDITQMLTSEYPTSSQAFTAPEAVKDYDCVISVASLQTIPSIFGSLHNLIGLLPHTLYPDRDFFLSHDGLLMVAEAFRPHIDGVVIVVDHRVFWGDDMLAVDEAACRLAGVGGETSES
jgi:hypothetical protein